LDGIHPISFDEPMGIPSDQGMLISTRTMQILGEETDLPYVTDPMGGSYYVEWLTSKMEEEVNSHLKKMEEMGGFMGALKSGWLRGEVSRQAYERMKKFDAGESVRVAENKYQLPEDKKVDVKFVRRSKETEDRVIEECKKYKKDRDMDKVNAGLADVRKVCEGIKNDWPNSAGTLIPAQIEAFRAKATSGEICRQMRDVFGFGFFII